MFFSLIIVTTNRFPLVERLLYSLTNQRFKRFEILFVHGQKHSGEAQLLVEKFNAHLNIRTFTSPSDSASAARNVPLSFTQGDVIAFPDDDCVYPPCLLQTVYEIFNARPDVDALLGARSDFHNWQKVQLASAPKISRVKSRYNAFRNSETFLQFYRKQCVEKVGEFDETLGPGTGLPYGSGEDTDYVLRAFAMGFVVFRSPEVIVMHSDISMGKAEIYPKAKAYAAGRMRLLQKHRMPLWFILANIMYPLCRIPFDCVPIMRYRWSIFQARLAASIDTKK